MLESMGNCLSVRLDRILLKSENKYWKTKSIEIIGKEKVPLDSKQLPVDARGLKIDMWPSDHFG